MARCQGSDPRGLVDRASRVFLIHGERFPGVQADSYLRRETGGPAMLHQLLLDRHGATHCRGGILEGDEEAVSSVIDLPAAVLFE